MAGKSKAGKAAKKLPPLGTGARFRRVKRSAAAHGAVNPGAVAYEAGVAAHGKAEMAALAAAGRKRAAAKRALKKGK
jgi:hypothetical protein